MSTDAKISYGYAMSESLPYDEIEWWKSHPFCYFDKLEDIINTPDESYIRYFVEVDLKIPGEIKEKTKIFHFVLRK